VVKKYWNEDEERKRVGGGVIGPGGGLSALVLDIHFQSFIRSVDEGMDGWID
jgi:hypothetical protein